MENHDSCAINVERTNDPYGSAIQSPRDASALSGRIGEHTEFGAPASTIKAGSETPLALGAIQWN